jgi:aryl-alcohol dehydrogenase-like predicted oxidoreductase
MRTIGTSDLKIYPLALGGNTFGWTSDQAASEAVLDGFAAAGGNFIDTADGYSAWVPGNEGGESETIIGDWMKSRGNRDELVIATKVASHPKFPGLSASNIMDAADCSLDRLQTDRIDLYYAHYDDAETPLLETVAAFDQLVQAGKVRYVGLSNYEPARIAEWIRIAKDNGFALPVALQPHYNLVHRSKFEQEYAPLAADNELAVFPYFSLASGFLTGKYRSAADAEGRTRGSRVADYLTEEGFGVVTALEEVAAARGASVTTTALAWLLAKPAITAPLASASKPEQLADLFAAADLQLTAAEVAALDEASKTF